MTEYLNRTALGLALALATSTAFAQQTDHAAHGHEAPAPTAPTPASEAGMPMMNHGGMDHGEMPMMDHGGMDHGEMPMMDHGSMDHSDMPRVDHRPGDRAPGVAADADPGEAGPRHDEDLAAPGLLHPSFIPVLTDADRAAAFPAIQGHTVHDKYLAWTLVFDQFEYQDADEGSVFAWDASGWIGGDIDRLWLRSEGERVDGHTEEAELQLLYGHAIGPWWEAVAGVRQDFEPGEPQTWAALGVQGMPLYGLETEVTAYLGEGGQSALRLEGEYDILLTNRLILQPELEVNLYGEDDHARGVGSGLANTEFGLRLRYEIHRQFAPYLGVSWNRTYGDTADLVREEGGDREETRFVAGIRFWF